MQNTKGFSLVEMIIVMGILGILTAISIPPLLSWRSSSKIRGETLQLVADMQKARMYAVNGRNTVVLQFSDAGYDVFVDDGANGGLAGDWNRQEKEKLLSSRRVPAGFSIKTNFPLNRFRFKGYGRNQPGKITLSGDSGRMMYVIVNVIGRIRSTQ